MMSAPDRMVPLLSAPAITPVPGLRTEVIQGLQASYPGILTPEMRSLLQWSCGLTGGELGTVDFTSRWHPMEPLGVFRPCLTLAIDDEGRRWVAETSRHSGLPGPIWCVLSEPEVAIHVSDDLSEFLALLNATAHRGRTSRWLREISQEARTVWANRDILARRSQVQCEQNRELRVWLAGLPLDAHVYDLRRPWKVRGWPYGLAGPDGCLHRCGKLPVFAVSTHPTASRWTQHLGQIAASLEMPRPAATRSRSARADTCPVT